MLAAALTLGFLGSLHCVGMCGPLVLAMPAGAGGPVQRWMRRLVYHLGRSSTYGVMGAVFGGLGHAAALAGWQGRLSVAAGLAVLVLAWPRAVRAEGVALSPFSRVLHRLRSAWAAWMARPGWLPLVGLGAVNGLLPCGLVYAALAGAALTGGVARGFAFMFAFGLATLPALLAVSAAPALLRPSWRAPLRRLAPLASGVLAVLLICRGLGFSPCCPKSTSDDVPSCCHAVDSKGGPAGVSP